MSSDLLKIRMAQRSRIESEAAEWVARYGLPPGCDSNARASMEEALELLEAIELINDRRSPLQAFSEMPGVACLSALFVIAGIVNGGSSAIIALGLIITPIALLAERTVQRRFEVERFRADFVRLATIQRLRAALASMEANTGTAATDQYIPVESSNVVPFRKRSASPQRS